MSRYTSKHTGSEIDAAIDRAKAGGAIDTLLAGKAPAGYGLGGTFGDYIADADNATVDGKYRTNSGTLNLPDGVDGMFGELEVSTVRSDKSIFQVFRPGTSGYQRYSLERRRINGVWQQWEYVNPPMMIGIEYRTTERYLGKPVYVKLVNFGKYPASGTKTVAHKISNVENIVSCLGTSSLGYSVNGYSYVSAFYADKTNINITVTADVSNNEVKVMLKYTKTTD